LPSQVAPSAYASWKAAGAASNAGDFGGQYEALPKKLGELTGCHFKWKPWKDRGFTLW